MQGFERNMYETTFAQLIICHALLAIRCRGGTFVAYTSRGVQTTHKLHGISGTLHHQLNEPEHLTLLYNILYKLYNS